MLFKGKVFKFGDNIDTDVIIPARYLVTTESKVLAQHCMEDISQTFSKEVSEGDIIVGGENFGCGSSREQAVLSILGCGVKVILANSFARIFYRNSINRGLYAIEISESILKEIDNGDIISVDTDKGVIKNFDKDKVYKFNSIPKEMQKILDSGGMVELTKNAVKK